MERQISEAESARRSPAMRRSLAPLGRDRAKVSRRLQLRLATGAALLALGLLGLSCTPNRMYRSVSVEEHPEYSIAFVEFDDQGELWAPTQLDRVLAHLERLNETSAGVALVMFIHGWNADASAKEEQESNGTLYRFRGILTRLNQALRQELPDQEVPVLGVYLGWRGRVSSVPLVREASFYNRRGAAERIAGATATEAIYRLLMTLRRNPASRSVLIGHSFGSMILERALAQAAVSALLTAPGDRLLFPADLVVFLNPAGSANQTKQLVDILGRNRLKTYRFDDQGNRYQRPLLVSFTSEADTATRRFFPIGMRTKAINKKFREYGEGYCSPISRQRRLYTHTAGHLPALHSHEVSVGPLLGPAAENPPPNRLIPRFLHYEESYDPLTQQMSFSFDGERNRYTIRRKPLALNDTPYWIMRVPRELIPNHSAVMTEDAYRLIEAVLALSAVHAADPGTVVEREDGVRPVAIVPRLDGAALFVDRSRGVFVTSAGSARPVFLSCLRPEIDPSDAIGLSVSGPLAQVVLMSRRGAGSETVCDLELREFEVDSEGYRQRSRVRVPGSECYSAATVDLVGKRLFLSSDSLNGPSLWVVDLTEPTLRPIEHSTLAGDRAPTSLLFEPSLGSLFLAGAETGELWQIDTRSTDFPSRRIAEDLGWPVALAYARHEARLFVGDARGGRIWALDCAGGCGNPRVFLQSDSLENPSSLAAGIDGKLWIGDLNSQSLTTVLPDGTIESVIRSLSGPPGRPARPPFR